MSLKRLAAGLAFGLMAWLVAAPPALAHTGAPPAPQDVWTAWNWSLGLWVCFGLTVWVYARGWLRLEAHIRRPSARQTVCFAAAMIMLFAALLSPLDAASSALLSAHMTQHVLLMVGAAPLLALSRPLGPMLLGLPRALGRELGNVWRGSRWLRGVWGAISQPAVAGTLQVVGLWGWHIPAAYQAALANQWVHDAEHVTFLGTALLFWWWVLQPASQHGGNVAISFVAIFVTGLQSTLLALLMTTATQPWYPAYSASESVWGLSALSDQQMAGAIMWIVSTVIYLVTIVAVLAGWLRQMEASDRQRQPEWLRAQESSWER